MLLSRVKLKWTSRSSSRWSESSSTNAHECHPNNHLAKKDLPKNHHHDDRITASRQHNITNKAQPMPPIRGLLLPLLLAILASQAAALRLTNGGSSLNKGSAADKEQLNIGLIAPHTNFGKREYLRSINNAVTGLTKTRGAKLTFLKDYSFEQKNIHFDMMSLTPSPTGESLL